MTKRPSTPASLPSPKRQEFCPSLSFNTEVVEAITDRVGKEISDAETSSELHASDIYYAFRLALPKWARDSLVPPPEYRVNFDKQRDQIFDLLKKGVAPGASFADKEAVALHSVYIRNFVVLFMNVCQVYFGQRGHPIQYVSSRTQ